MRRIPVCILFTVLSFQATATVRYSTAWKGRLQVVPEITHNGLWRLLPAERLRADRFFRAVTAIYRAEPLLTRCNGYSVFIRRGFMEPSSWNRVLRPPFPGYPVQFHMIAAISAFLRQKDGSVKAWEDSTSSLVLTANSPRELFRHFKMSYRGLQDRHDREIFFEPKRLSGSGAVTRYEQDLVVVHKRPVPLFTPVTRGEYLQALIDRYTRKGPNANAFMADYFRKELAAQTPAQKRSPALHSPASGSPSGLVESAGRALVRINPAFFDRRKPRTAVQLIVFRFWYYIPEQLRAAAAASFERGGPRWVMARLDRQFAINRLASLVE